MNGNCLSTELLILCTIKPITVSECEQAGDYLNILYHISGFNILLRVRNKRNTRHSLGRDRTATHQE